MGPAKVSGEEAGVGVMPTLRLARVKALEKVLVAVAARAQDENNMACKWAYGVLTVPERRETLLPRTLASLAKAGFPEPRLFIDGARSAAQYRSLDLPVTVHDPRIGVFGNWVLALWELYLRDGLADRYAIFQDDLVAYRNLRQYLEQCPYPERGYWNLYVYSQDQERKDGKVGWFLSDQWGKGAVALVFNREAVSVLLGQSHITKRPQIANRKRSLKAVDGAVVEALTKGAGWKEWVHSPSLVQHTGEASEGETSIAGNKRHKRHLLPTSFRGEDFNALELCVLDICIPTLRSEKEIREQVAEIKQHTHSPHRIIASCKPGSAAENRNRCLHQAESRIIIMVDDDVYEFFDGWEKELIAPLLDDEQVCMVSARLLNPDGTVQVTCSGTDALEPRWITIPPQRACVLPAAAIAFRNVGLRFDENYVGSGREDGDFCFQYLAYNQDYKFVLTNACQLRHRNEKKGQGDGNLQKNRNYFRQKWEKQKCE